jgi:PAS domain S-box-containing protein
VVVIDAAYRITYWNAAAETMYGVRDADALGKQLSDIYTYDWFDAADASAAFDALQKTDHWRGENYHIRHDGVRIAVESSVTAERDAEGNITAMIAAIRSIDERRQAQEELRANRDELRRKNVELARANALKDEFLANMSHELRTPLTTVQILAEAMREQLYGPLNDRQLRAVKTIEESGQHLLALINDILDLSKIEAGQMQLLLERCSVAALCRDALSFIGHQAERKEMHVLAQLPADSVVVLLDARRVKQILINLLSNAVKFTQPRGTIELTARIEPETGSLAFSVRDTGIGISADDMPRLFQPFTQIDSGLSRSYAGTGLGLSLVHRMTDLHGGSISIASTPGEGSTFTVRLPMHAEQMGEGGGSVPAPDIDAGETHPASRKEIRILLVDDSESSLFALTEYLDLKGFQVTTARSGLEAVDRAANDAFDLVLMDVQMPGMTGLEATRRIRKLEDERRSRVPIVALTALAMPGDRERCMEAGVDDYLSKPVMFDTLLAMIGRVTGRTDATSS